MATIRTALPVSLRACGGGERSAAERILLRSVGVQAAYVNPATEMAYVEYDPALTTPRTLFEVLTRAGFAPAGWEVVRGGRWPADRGHQPSETLDEKERPR